MNILLLTRNLMTRVQLENSWRAAGATVLTQAAGQPIDLIAFDLNQPQALEALTQVKGELPDARLIAFGPHVDGEAFKAARAAGADECVARGSVIDRVLTRLNAG